MDDPWANAWGGSAAAQPSWRPSITTLNDDESDITVPAWSAATQDSQWSLDSDDHTSPGLWSQAAHKDDPSDDWGSSRFTNILSISKAQLSSQEQFVKNESKAPDMPPELQSPTPSEEADTLSQRSNSPKLRSHSPSPSPPGSPDAFGTFETGIAEPSLSLPNIDPSMSAFSEVDAELALNPAWDTVAHEEEGGDLREDQPDEWELARRQKERQDRQVSPEVLRAILSQCGELLSELSPSGKEEDGSDPDLPSRGMEGIPGLSDILHKYVTENISLPPMAPFQTTFSGKHMTEAIKMTRHCSFTKLSPMSQYLSSKGSTAWEASVKSRPEVVIEDIILPKGWKIVEKEGPKETPSLESKPSGGLLSFFGRRSTAPAANSLRQRSSSPTVGPPSMPRSSSSTTGSPRNSMDVNKSPTSATPPVISPLAPSQPASSTASAGSAPISSVSAAPSPIVAQPPDIFAEVTPPSAVSRFLGRFSRKGSTSSRSSMALSSNDLEYLNDIVPSAGDDDEAEASFQIKALTSMIESSPLPAKLPPPLPPPPRTPIIPPPPSPHSKRPVTNLVLQPTVLSSPSSRSQSPQPDSLDDWPLAFSATPGRPPSASSPSGVSPPFVVPLQPALATPPTQQQTPQNGLDDIFSSAVSTKGTETLAPWHNRNHPDSRTSAQTPQKRQMVTAIMSSKPLQTSVGYSLPPPPTTPRRTPTLSPPRQTTTEVPLISGSSAGGFSAHLPPPPASTTAAALLMDDDDEFADFHSGTPEAPANAKSGFGDFSHSMTSFTPSRSNGSHGFSPSSTFETLGNTSTFDDFDDFLTAPSPSFAEVSPAALPAREIAAVPSKRIPPPAIIALPSPESSTSPPRKFGHQRISSRVSESQHQRTQSLVNVGASKQGRWPAPPSPLPQAIPPPQPSSSNGSFDVFGDDLPTDSEQAVTRSFSGGDSMQQQQARALAGLAVPAFTPSPQLHNSSAPLSFTPPPRSFFGQGNGHPTQDSFSLLQPSGRNQSTGPKSDTGGLSAQDLSFFEGL